MECVLCGEKKLLSLEFNAYKLPSVSGKPFLLTLSLHALINSLSNTL